MRAERLEELAKAQGFDAAGLICIGHRIGDRVGDTDNSANLPELAHVERWLEAGNAGEMEYLKRRDEAGRLRRSDMQIALPWARSAIVCAMVYNTASPYSIEAAPADSAWIARYAWSGSNLNDDGDGTGASDYHDILLKKLRSLEAALHLDYGEFESRSYVDTGPFIERVYAKYAGLGWLAKNTCLINQRLGSWTFLGAIVTSLEAQEDEPRAAIAPDRCGSCTRCIDACPTAALTPYWMDASRCISYLTIEKRGTIPMELREGMGRQVFGCDICQDVCPWNRKAPVTFCEDLKPREKLVNPPLEWLGAMDENTFKRWFKGSPIERAKFRGFQRNIAIAMGNSEDEKFLPRLQQWQSGEDRVLAESASWAAEKIATNRTLAGRDSSRSPTSWVTSGLDSGGREGEGVAELKATLKPGS